LRSQSIDTLKSILKRKKNVRISKGISKTCGGGEKARCGTPERRGEEGGREKAGGSRQTQSGTPTTRTTPSISTGRPL